ncbi:hypothetical protein DXG03_005184 [Asterophora parasitica]|uniref:Uncharacterized protein n=1 Tax=Asterophora parasitica TaxID=117018 RepID=A0A9P7G853_9AGAR|nr:hypothetical protein DXG03_005184 [Asterophora parasitica]
MIKSTTEPGASALSNVVALKSFPTSPLIVASVVSCFIATAAFACSFVSVNSWYPHFIVPNLIGFLATVPYHVYLYLAAQAHRPSHTHSDPIFISPFWIIYGFILVPLWVVIFYINILYCVGTREGAVVPTTIFSGIEWILLLFITLYELRQIWRVENSHTAVTESQSTSSDSEDTPATTPTYNPHRIYFVSFVLCTLTLMFGIDVSLACPFNVAAFFLTAPHHIALYIASVRPQSPSTAISRPTAVPLAFLLAAVWVGLLVVNIFSSRYLYQTILTSIFGGLEVVIIAYLAIRSVLDNFSEGQIKL